MTTPIPVIAGIGATVGKAVSAAVGDARTTAGGVLGTVGEVADTARGVVKAGQWLANPHNWVRIVYVTGGAALILVAAAMLVNGTASGPVKSVAGALITKGV